MPTFCEAKSFSLPAFLPQLLRKKRNGKLNLQKILLSISLLFTGDIVLCQSIRWDFDKADSLANVMPGNITVSKFRHGNVHGSAQLFNTSSASSGYAGASGNYNASLATVAGALDPEMSSYFEFTFSPESGYSFSVNSIQFGSRSTSTGPASYSFRCSIDNYASDIVSGIFPVDSRWYVFSHSTIEQTEFSGPVTFRIYGFNGSGASKTTVNWRIDDLAVGITLSTTELFLKTIKDGDWTDISVWASSGNKLDWFPASKLPSVEFAEVLISEGHTIKISSEIKFPKTKIAGKIELHSGGILKIEEDSEFEILKGGVLQVLSAYNYSTSVIDAEEKGIRIHPGGKILVGNGVTATGKGYEAFATSNKNIWNDDSVFEWNDKSIFPVSKTILFANAESVVPIFRISNIGGAIAVGSSNEFLINGLLEVNTDVNFSGAGRKNVRSGIKGNGKVTQSGAGKIYFTGSNAILSGQLILDLAQPLDLGSFTHIPEGSKVTLLNKNLNNNIAGNVLAIDGILDVTIAGITNTNGKIVLNGTFITANPGGFYGSGASIPSGNVILNSGCTIELNAVGDQKINARSDFKNLIFSNSGIKKPMGPFSPSGTITIRDNATFDCSGVNVGDDNTNLSMHDNSKLIVTGYGPNPPMNGTYDLTGGVVEFNGSNLTPQTIRNKAYQNIDVSGTNVNNSDGNIILKKDGIFRIRPGGVFTINDNTIAGPTGNQTVLVEGGGIFRTGNSKGFHGFAFTTVPKFNSSVNADIENIILEPSSTVEYTRVTTDQPITNTNNLLYQNLTLTGGANKIAPENELMLAGNFINNNSPFIHNNGSVVFKGNQVQHFNSGSPFIFNNLRIETIHGLKVHNDLSVFRQLYFGEQSAVLLDANISILSSKTQTAWISRIPIDVNISYGSGRFVIERYINTNVSGGHGKSWQFLSAPVFGESIFNTWQEKGNTSIAGYGTWITDPAGKGKGFDDVSFAPSVKVYEPVTNTWIGIPSTFINLENYQSYMIFIRGDRSANSLNALPTPTIMKSIGMIYTPSNPPPIIKVLAGKFQPIGNPYASAIDYSKIDRSPEIENSFHVWDPEYYGEHGLGGYQTISPVLGYKAIPGNTSLYNSTSDYRYIQSGQAFFVRNFSSKDGSVQMNEDCKVEGNHRLVNREITEGKKNHPILFTRLFSLNGTHKDANAVAFAKYFSNDIDGDDASKFSNANENFGLKREGKILIIEARNSIQKSDTLFYNLENVSKQDYRLYFSPENFEENIDAFLWDDLLQKEIPISLSDTSSVCFSITGDASSFRADRFKLILKKREVPLSIILTASAKDDRSLLSWKISNISQVKELHVEHSNNGRDFYTVQKIMYPDEIAFYLHSGVQEGNNFYRLKIITTDESIYFSKTEKIVMEEYENRISIYPNPVLDNYFYLNLQSQPVGDYRFFLLDGAGKTVFSGLINHNGGNHLEKISFKRKISKGLYHLQIIKPDGSVILFNLIR